MKFVSEIATAFARITPSEFWLPFPSLSHAPSALVRRAIYPGSFDPITNGHLDVLQRATKIFDEVIIAVALNAEKSGLFTPEERVELIRDVVNPLKNVQVAQFQGLLVEFARKQAACAVIRGLRAISDFEFEFQMALMNRKLESEVETIFLMPREEYTYLSSRIVKEIAGLGGNIDGFVPAQVALSLRKRLGKS
jgi:pantetheine-phosphate adenylyltransferase